MYSNRGLIAAAASMACLAPAAVVANRGVPVAPPDVFEPVFLPNNRGRPTTKRGKHKLPRHGQKLKSCRNKISRRVRRKHRRAA